MRFGAAIGVNRTGWPELREACLLVEEAGWETLYIEDHLLADEGDWRDSKLEGWATLAGLATLTSQVRLCHLVVANTFRNPGLTAKLASTLDQLSDGRMILGIGGGWFEREHEAFGIEFPSPSVRLDWLDESVTLIRRLLDGETVTHSGPHYRFDQAICAPRPIQPKLPILIGGMGKNKTLRTVARHADIWNTYRPKLLNEGVETLKRHCAGIGRDFSEIDVTLCQQGVIRDDAEEAVKYHSIVAANHGLTVGDGSNVGDGYETVLDLDVHGDPASIARQLRPLVDAGVAEVIWIFRSPYDLETISRISEVRAALDHSYAQS
jgi:alkanesulfonate monooxygenase SsuD/methylene tetrahydromethanopterin reductase-like flavin-dependent oxidoreductase (luciferase family)